MSRPTALVTGACSGIGLALAEELGARGYALVLVSNRAAELEAAALKVGAQHFLVQDLAQPTAADVLQRAVAQLGVQIDVLVNNAGFLAFGEVVDEDPARVQALLQLHVVTPSLLARHFGAAMRARGSGHIVFTSSISAWRAFPGIALYGASKRYLLDFACALRSELSPWGVNVTVVAPGPTLTGLYDARRVPVALATRLGVMVSAQKVARAAVDGMVARRAVVIPGLLAKLFAWGAALTPQFVVNLVRRRAPWLPMPGRNPR